MNRFADKLNAIAHIADDHDRLDAYRDLAGEYRVMMAFWSLTVELAHQCSSLRRRGHTWEAAMLREEALDALADTRRLNPAAAARLANVIDDELNGRCRAAA